MSYQDYIIVWRIVLELVVCMTFVRCASQDICQKDICEFDFRVYKVQTMTYRTHNETLNVRDNEGSLEIKDNGYWDERDDWIGQKVSSDDVITVDGFQRHVITVNGKFPGPTIEVMQGAQVGS